MFGIFSASGVKRLIASLLMSVAAALRALGEPNAQLLAATIEGIAAFFGATGLAHASINKGALRKYAFASLGALIALAQYIPLLQPYLGILNEASILLAGASVGQIVGEKKEKRLSKQKLSTISKKNAQ